MGYLAQSYKCRSLEKLTEGLEFLMVGVANGPAVVETMMPDAFNIHLLAKESH